MAETTNLEIVIKAVDEASKQLEAVKGELKDMGEEGEKSNRIMGAVGSGLKVLAGFAVAGATAIAGFSIASVKKFADVGDELDKMSIRTGVSVESLSKLSYAGDLANVSMGTIEGALKKLAMASGKVLEGNKEMTYLFEELGVSANDLVNAKPDELFLKIASGISEIPDPLQRASLMMDVFGKSGTDLLPLLQQDLNETGKEAEKMGIVFSADMAKSAADFKDAQTRISGALDGLKLQVAGEIMPVLANLMEKILGAIGKFKDWFDTMGGFEGIKNKVVGWIGELITQIDLNTGIITTLRQAWDDIVAVFTESLMPTLAKLWEALKPYQPYLEMLAKIIGVILLGALLLVLNLIKFSLILVMEALKFIIDGITTALQLLTKGFDWLTDKMAGVIAWGEKLVNTLRDVWEWIVKVYDKIAGGVGKAIGAVSGAFSAVAGAIGFADGGIVRRPTFALIGEAGPEAVIPLNQLVGVGGSGGITININGGTYLSEDVAVEIGNKIINKLKTELRF